MSAGKALALVLILSVASTLSCGDPVHDEEVDALGPEAPGVSPGPEHRPGQPCLTCHGIKGPASGELAVAGTVFQTSDPRSASQANVVVDIYDAPPLDTANGTGGVALGPPARTAATNGAGNFFIRASDYSPSYPLRVDLRFEGLTEPTRMTTRIGRSGSCATCHFEPRGKTSPGHVYLVADLADLPGAGAKK